MDDGSVVVMIQWSRKEKSTGVWGRGGEFGDHRKIIMYKSKKIPKDCLF